MPTKLNLLFLFRAQRRKTDRSASALESSSSPYPYSSDTFYVPLCTLRRDMSVSLLSVTSPGKDPTQPGQECQEQKQNQGQVQGQNDDQGGQNDDQGGQNISDKLAVKSSSSSRKSQIMN